MAELHRRRHNGLDGASLGAALTDGTGTSVTFTAALQAMGANIATLGADEFLPLVIENEIVYLTAYTSGATTGTIARAKEGTTGAAHANSTPVVHGPTVADAGTFWTPTLDNPLTSLTGLTTFAGTWSVASGQVQCVAGGVDAARLIGPDAVLNPALCIVECEIELPAPGASKNYGVVLTKAGAGTSGGFAFRIDAGTSITMERDSEASMGSVSYTQPTTGTWVKLRMVVNGASALGYIDGVLLYSGHGFGMSKNQLWYPGVRCGGTTTVRYRNLKSWSADLNLPV